MLEKNEKIIYYDAHFHLPVCIDEDSFDVENKILYKGCSCVHSKEEWFLQERYLSNKNFEIKKSFGIHPQNPDFHNIEFLEKLLEEKKIDAIGETGFDLFTEEFKKERNEQEYVWNIQIELAIKYKLPVIVHCRKANDKLFEYSNQLKKIPAVLFHSFMGTTIEAKSLLNRNINAYFSFGKQVLNNNKKVIVCVNELPIDRLLCETDAPFQFLKGESKTFNSEIKKVYEYFWQSREKEVKSFEEFVTLIERNYKSFIS